MTTITEFLLARIAEDERYVEDGWADLDRMDTNRLEAEYAAKRRIMEAHDAKELAFFGGNRLLCSCGHGHPCPTLRALASVYADHPDYDPAWA